MNRDWKKEANANKDGEIYYGIFIIGKYELNNVNINQDRKIDRLMWYGSFLNK